MVNLVSRRFGEGWGYCIIYGQERNLLLQPKPRESSADFCVMDSPERERGVKTETER